MNADTYEISYLRYRQDVVSRWPNSDQKQVVLEAIESRLRRLAAAGKVSHPRA